MDCPRHGFLALCLYDNLIKMLSAHKILLRCCIRNHYGIVNVQKSGAPFFRKHANHAKFFLL